MMIFRLKRYWFDKIKSGEKTHEYRIANNYWDIRIIDNLFPGDTIMFTLGYPKKDNRDKILYAKIIEVSAHNGLETDLKIDKIVYDIEFELIKDNNNVKQ